MGNPHLRPCLHMAVMGGDERLPRPGAAQLETLFGTEKPIFVCRFCTPNQIVKFVRRSVLGIEIGVGRGMVGAIEKKKKEKKRERETGLSSGEALNPI